MKVKQLLFNRPQLRFVVTLLNSAISIWGRATGKSTLIAWLIHLIVQTMPRSKWGLVGSTFKQILTLTLPSTIASLERLGYYKNKHYFIGRRPPKNWQGLEPYEPPLNYEHCLYFWKQGVVFQFISQDAGGASSRGTNLDGIISDESLLLNKERYDSETSAANRGNLHQFEGNRLHHGEFHFSSMPYGDQGKWLLEAGRHYGENGNDVLQLQTELINMQLKFIDRKDREFRIKLWQEMEALSKQIRYYPNVDGLLYSEANAFDNITNLGLKFLESQREKLTEFVFMVEVLNKRPGTVEAGFYPTLNYKKHTYEAFNNDYLQGLEYDIKKLSSVDSRMDGDCNPNEPLRLSVDWGSKISVLLTAQIHELAREYRFLKGMYVKHPQLIDDLADQWCDYYEHHKCRRVVFIEDSEWGNARKPDSDLTYNEQFIARLKRRGWTVTRLNMGRVPSYQTRYHLAHEMLSERDTRLLKIRFNKHNCKDVLTALSMAPVKQGLKGEIVKDKSSEKKLTVPGQEATHFTDTFDLQLVSIDKHVIRLGGNFDELMFITS